MRVQGEDHYIEKNIFGLSHLLKWSSSFTEVNKTEKAVLSFDSSTLLRSCCRGQGEPKVFLLQRQSSSQKDSVVLGQKATTQNTWIHLCPESLSTNEASWYPRYDISSQMGWIPSPQVLKDQALYPGLWTTLLSFTSWFSEYSYTQHF